MSEQQPSVELLERLLNRWQEVADAYKPGDLPWDDIDRKYRDQRLIYLRNIRDLRHVLDTGQIPCALMTAEERRRGDCGQVHDEEDVPPEVSAPVAREPWGPGVTAEQAALAVVSLHIAQAFIQSSSEEVHVWARELAHELKRELFDLSGPIAAHLVRMTLHKPALGDDVPF